LILFTFIYLLSYLPLHTFCQTAKHSLPFSVLFCWGGVTKYKHCWDWSQISPPLNSLHCLRLVERVTSALLIFVWFLKANFQRSKSAGVEMFTDLHAPAWLFRTCHTVNVVHYTW